MAIIHLLFDQNIICGDREFFFISQFCICLIYSVHQGDDYIFSTFEPSIFFALSARSHEMEVPCCLWDVKRREKKRKKTALALKLQIMPASTSLKYKLYSLSQLVSFEFRPVRSLKSRGWSWRKGIELGQAKRAAVVFEELNSWGSFSEQ